MITLLPPGGAAAGTPFIPTGGRRGVDRLAVGTAASIGVILALVVSASVASAGEPASAQIGVQKPERTATVTGAASSSVPPDRLVVVFGVEVVADTAREALSSNSEMMGAVIESLRGAGVSDDEISTSDLRVYPQYSYGESDEPSIRGYSVSNTVRVETGMLGSATEIIDGGVAAGANRVETVSFGLSPEARRAVSDALIERAVLDAREKAETAIGPLGQRIVGVKSVSLVDMPPDRWMPAGLARASADFALESAAAPTPVFASDATVTVQAEVSFLIAAGRG